jgi:hypothetical protein
MRHSKAIDYSKPTRVAGKGPTKLIGSMLLVVALSAATFADTELAYVASFGGNTLEPTLDKLDFGSLKRGDAEIDGSNPTAMLGNGEVILSVTRPADLATGVVASGLFVTDLEFDQGSLFGLQATFIRPAGPISGGWGAAINARTGDESDLFGETRVNATLNVRPGGSARLNVPFGATSQTFVDLPAPVYEAIFRPDNPEPFTLQLLVDRVTGNGKASLKVGAFPVLSRSFQLSQFQANSGDPITAVGPAIANANAPGQTVSVHLRDFRIYVGSAGKKETDWESLTRLPPVQ